MPMKQKERSVPASLIAIVKFVYEVDGKIDDRIGVVFKRPGDGVGEIGNQGEVKVRVGVGEEADFQLLDEPAELLFVHQQRGYRDESGELCGNSAAEVQFRQRLGLKESGDNVIEEVDSALRGRQEQQKERQR